MEALNRAFGAALCAAAMMGVPATAGAQHLFKCGSAYQDRPCESNDVQQRYSHASGDFSVEQVNADTDKDCAQGAARMMPLWQRMNGGEPVEKIRAEIDGQPVTRAEKSRMRDVLLNLKLFKGNSREVRSELERQCMNYKKMHGVPTEADIDAQAKAQSARAALYNSHSIEAQQRAMEARRRTEERNVEWQEQMRRAQAAQAARAAALRAAREKQDQ